MDTQLRMRTACTVVQIDLAVGKEEDSCNGIKLLVSLRSSKVSNDVVTPVGFNFAIADSSFTVQTFAVGEQRRKKL